MGGQQCVEDAADLVQVGHIVGKPGDEPAQGKEGRDAALIDVPVKLCIALQSAQSSVRGSIPCPRKCLFDLFG